MVATAIVILTLVLAFFEKPHLFKKPFKIDKFLVVIMLIGVAVFSGVKEYQTSIQEDRAHAIIDSLQGESIALLEQVQFLREDNRFAQTSLVELTKLMARNNQKVDTLQKSIISKETPPTLTISDYSIDTLSHERHFNYTLRAINSNAHVIDYYYALIDYSSYKKDTPVVWSGSSMNFTSIIIPNEPRPMTVFMDRYLIFPKHCYLAMEFTYKSKGNRVQTPLRKVYEVYNGISVREVDSYDFVQISMTLKKHKIWEKFYDL